MRPSSRPQMLPAMQERARRVVIAAGGSGGHLYPAFALADELERRGAQVFFIGGGTKGGSLPVRQAGAGAARPEVLRLAAAPFRGARSFVSPAFLVSWARDFARTGRALARIRPDFVAGFGGLHSIPAVLLGFFLGIRTVIHEQNAEFGKANRFLLPFASFVACAFPPPAGAAKRKVRTGMPLRGTLKKTGRGEALRRLGLDPAKRTLVVMGGSQGARAVNRAFLSFAAACGEELKDAWQVVHLSGAADAEELRRRAPEFPFAYRQFSFFEEMSIIYEAADFLVCRAGAVTLHEIAFFSKCALLVPYPWAGAHQAANAKVLADAGAAFVVEEKNLSAETFREKTGFAASCPDEARRMGERCAALLDTRGAANLAEEVLRPLA